ncbi:MAG: hypothetical protein E3J70_08645 [Candidatus Heimdallarchaeota archaeon]|nr:MAG: hypothetical protein E3J70_08645 [Candidatus Heimdallarchaeota archaeon]
MIRFNTDLKKGVTSFLLFLLFPSLFTNIVKANTSNLPTIQVVNRVSFNQEFDCRHIAFGGENNRLFVSNNGIKMYDVSNPLNVELIGSNSNQSHAIMKYHNGYLFTLYFTYQGQRFRVYSITPENDIIYVNRSVPFNYASGTDSGVKFMYFPSDDLMITCGGKIRLWDISDLNNLTCLSDYFYTDLLFGGSFGEQVTCAGLAFHPDEEKFLIDVNYVHTGQIFLVDYSNPSNLSVIDFNLESFDTNQSALKISTKYSLISNNYYPCFTTDAYLETINWLNASEPTFRSRYQLPRGDDPLLKIRLVLYDDNKILVYRKISGIIDVSDSENNEYITEYNTSRSIYSYYQPAIKDDFIFCLNWKLRVIGESITYYITIWKVNPYTKLGSNKWSNSIGAMFIVLFTLRLYKRKRKSKLWKEKKGKRDT